MHTLSPALPLEDRKKALEFVIEQNHPDILRETLSPGLEVTCHSTSIIIIIMMIVMMLVMVIIIIINIVVVVSLKVCETSYV